MKSIPTPHSLWQATGTNSAAFCGNWAFPAQPVSSITKSMSNMNLDRYILLPLTFRKNLAVTLTIYILAKVAKETCSAHTQKEHDAYKVGKPRCIEQT